MRKDHSSVNRWSVKELVDAINGESSKRTVFIPPFQRNVVWRDDKRQDFIESLKKGYPFGSLLLSGTNTESGKFQLIDGLQRTNTILEYYRKRTQFVTDDEIRMHDTTIQKTKDLICLPDHNKDALIQAIGSWIRDRQDFDPQYGYTAYQLSGEILDKFEKEGDRKTFDAFEIILNPFLNELKEEANIDNVQIPIVIYTGPEEDLATIFEKINSQGTTLNKYQIFAAAWSGEGYQLNIDRIEIADLIRERYTAWIEAGLQVSHYDETMSAKNFRAGKFTIFEYLFGLSRLLVTGEHQRLFSTPGNKADTDPISFNLCTACLGIKLNDMKKELPKKLLTRLELGQTKFEDTLFDAIGFVDHALDRFIDPEFNMKKGRRRRRQPRRRYHNDYQIIALISTVFREKYDEELNVRSSWASKEKKIQSNIPYHYLYDILRKYWVGVKDFDNLDYSREIHLESWDSLLDQWFEDSQLRRRESKRISGMRDADYLFLNYIYTYVILHGEVLSPKEFELEHIVPVKLLQRLIKKSNGQGLPISAISNFGLISRELNARKRDSTIYQYFDKQLKNLDDLVHINEIQAEITDAERLLFISRDDLDFVGSVNVENYERLYTQFLGQRFDRLKTEFYQRNNVKSIEED